MLYINYLEMFYVIYLFLITQFFYRVRSILFFFFMLANFDLSHVAFQTCASSFLLLLLDSPSPLFPFHAPTSSTLMLMLHSRLPDQIDSHTHSGAGNASLGWTRPFVWTCLRYGLYGLVLCSWIVRHASSHLFQLVVGFWCIAMLLFDVLRLLLGILGHLPCRVLHWTVLHLWQWAEDGCTTVYPMSLHTTYTCFIWICQIDTTI